MIHPGELTVPLHVAVLLQRPIAARVEPIDRGEIAEERFEEASQAAACWPGRATLHVEDKAGRPAVLTFEDGSFVEALGLRKVG